MAKAVPIRPDVEFAYDSEREIIDYLICRVKHHIEAYDEPPHTAAVVLHSDKGRTTHSFSLEPKSDQCATCASAAALLLQRAAE